MSALYLIRARIALDELARWSGERGWSGGHGGVAFDEGRALHHLLYELFGPKAVRPFRLLVPPRRRHGNLYAYASMDCAALRQAALVQAKPEHLGVLPLDRLEGRQMPGEWRVGQRLGFDVRVRPTRRLGTSLPTKDGQISPGAELDAFQWEALRHHPERGDGMAEAGRTREAVYLDWLAERLAGAADLVPAATRLIRFRRSRAVRGKKAVEGPDAVFHGTLTVADGAAFAGLLAGGLGRHRAYGYGMLLLTAPSKPKPEC